MKKLIFSALLGVLSLSSFANDPVKKPANTNTPVSSSEIWAEEKLGTWRGGRLNRFLFGMCKASPNLCCIIFHEGDRPTDLMVVSEDGTTENFPIISYTEGEGVDEEGNTCLTITAELPE